MRSTGSDRAADSVRVVDYILHAINPKATEYAAMFSRPPDVTGG
jgi:hypothetical protein